MAEVSTKPWGSISESDYATPEAFCSAALIDLNPAGQPKKKALCKLPVKEPGGALNRNGVYAAAQRLVSGVDAPPDAKRAAARKLVAFYGQLKADPPESLRRMAM